MNILCRSWIAVVLVSLSPLGVGLAAADAPMTFTSSNAGITRRTPRNRARCRALNAGPPPAGAGRPATTAPVAKLNSGSVDELVRADDGGGGAPKVLLESGQDRTLRSMSVSSDGTGIVCYLVGNANTAGPAQLRAIRVADPDPSTRREGREADRSGEAQRPRLRHAVPLPDQAHIGLSVCELPDHAPPPLAPATAAARPGGGLRVSDVVASRRAWDAGALPAQPMIATIDLEGANLKEIGPGAMPS